MSAVKELNKEEYQLFDKSRKAPEVKQEPFSYEKQRKLEVNHQTDIKNISSMIARLILKL
nr:hypothetical protein [Bacillus velezensis]